MSRWLPAVTLGALLAVIVVGALVGLRPAGADPSAATRAEGLAAELRCPDCQGLSVADSPTNSAQEIRRQIDGLLADGATDDEVRAHFTARYGEWILLAPSSPVTWVLPFVVVALGVVGLGAWLLARRDASPASPAPAVTEAERRRLHEEAEALDA
jgi:cytochrome c-type biogenesis protein CcmH